MIAVIADDLTGAAEIGGIALRYNLTVEVVSDLQFAKKADVVVVNANTRSLAEEQARAIIKTTFTALRKLNPQLIFKKIDSVLRGHVLAEIEEQMLALGMRKALILAANPSLGRTIKNGEYWIEGKLIHETGFAHDPEYPAKSASVKDLLRVTSSVFPVHIQQHENDFAAIGITIGDIEILEDFNHWLKHTHHDVALAGSSAFFNALLAQRFTNLSVNRKERLMLKSPIIYVCGSKFDKSINLVKQAQQQEVVSYMPAALAHDVKNQDSLLMQWQQEIIQILQSKAKVIIAVNTLEQEQEAKPEIIKSYMAEVLNLVLQEVKVKELVIEGGATASAILDKLKINRLLMVQEIAQGLTRSMAKDQKINITLKPGSYTWTKNIWKF
ncbi:four-carbon acid sugar kinase family protein [Pedobacter glucosidilyticus]|uniref:four-carbon acid sugar kinase family protein n=1 Tax=Pedobacter glucosidilyticus TaxID=1122941 RepID=UPI0026F17569|nr:four-carbon acid sugar kinase family protein [Pedobacter glucosidilyticus]